MSRLKVYLDNAATSWPKPKSVLRAMQKAMNDVRANPGRGGYAAARAADRLLYEARRTAARLFNAPDPARVIFTPGATWSMNMALRGFLRKGDHVMVFGRQHNAVVRPLHALRHEVKVIHARWDGRASIEKLVAARVTPKTCAIVVNHASNVDGFLYPLDQIGRAAKKRGLALIVDAAQSAGGAVVDMRRQNIGILCCTGHKGLMGPSGTGLLILNAGVDLDPIVAGGTGSYSADPEMPREYPDRLEAGSVNLSGILGLEAGMNELLRRGIPAVIDHKRRIAERAAAGLAKIPGVKLYWPKDPKRRVALFSFNIEGRDAAEVGDIFDEKYGIACRIGFHCATEAHWEVGTFPSGTVRFAPGLYTTAAQVDYFVRAVRAIAGKK